MIDSNEISFLKMSPLQKRQVVIFCLGWISYAATYLLRKPLGIIKTDLETEFGFSKTLLGVLDTALLLPYAFVQIFLSSIGDTLGSRQTMALAMMISGASMVTFCSWKEFSILFLLLAINGAAQGLCWPNVCKILGSWYPQKSRNSVFGIFGTSAFAGGMIGTILAVYTQSTYGWKFTCVVPSLIMCVLGLMVYMFLKTPEEICILIPGRDPSCNTSQPTLSFLDVWKIPMVFETAVAMFCLKLVRYCLYMWLPLYLLDFLHYTKAEAGWLSTVFEVGGVFGSALLGIIIDRFLHGGMLIGSTLSSAISTIGLIGFFMTSQWGIIPNCLFMAIAGAFNCGPDTILGGSLPSEIGEANGRNAAAAVTGVINGFGSFGSCFEGPIVGLVSQYYGWSGMFYLMIFLSGVATFATYRAEQKNKNQKVQFELLH